MRASLSAVQQALVLLPVASLAFAVLVRPHPENRRFMAALDEVSAFRADFKRSALEKSLRTSAEAQGALPLSALRDAEKQKRGPKLQVEETAPPILPLTTVRLATLAEVYAHAQSQSALTIGSPDVQALGAALAWRLSHLEKPGPFLLTNVELKNAAVSQEDVALEVEVAELRAARAQAQTSVEQATARFEMEDNVFEARRKRHLPWKVLVKSVEARKAARDALDEQTRILTDAEQRYQAAVARAQQPRELTNSPAVPERAVAQVTLTQGSDTTTLQIPVALDRREAPVPALPYAFSATREAGLWDEVKGLDAEAAIGAIRSHFNWHYHYVEVLGIKFGGMTVLQLLPCLLPFLLGLLLLRIRAASASYSPFSTKVRGALPRVGLKNRGLEGVALVFLPFLTGAISAAALLVIGQVPVLPAVAAVACLLLGISAFGKLGDLQELVASVVHSHSYPPAPGDEE